MKKTSFFFCLLCLILTLGLSACGTGMAKVTGILAGVGTEQNHPFVFGNPLLNGETLEENDYSLQVGQKYLLGVTYTQSGGSIVCSIGADSITLKYDADIFEITPPAESEGMEVYYTLTCKRSVGFAAIIVEVDNEYTYTVIVSAS